MACRLIAPSFILDHVTVGECSEDHISAQDCTLKLESLLDTCSVASFVLTSEMLYTESGSENEQTMGDDTMAGGDGKGAENEASFASSTDEAHGGEAGIKASGAGVAENERDNENEPSSGVRKASGDDEHPESVGTISSTHETGEDGVETGHDIIEASGDAGGSDDIACQATTRQDAQGDPDNPVDDISEHHSSLPQNDGARSQTEEIPATVAALQICVIPTAEAGN